MQLKKIYKNKKNENKILLKNIAEMNTECYTYKKIFNEGIHEIAKELLKLHEMQLDKVINNKGNNKSNINSIYFFKLHNLNILIFYFLIFLHYFIQIY